MDTFRGVDPLRQETFWKEEGGGSWEEGIKFVPCAGGFYWAGELEDSVARVFFESIFSFEVAKIQDHWNNCKEDIVKSSWIAIGYNDQSWN